MGSWFVEDIVLLAKSENELQKVVDEFKRSCRRMKLRENLA